MATRLLARSLVTGALTIFGSAAPSLAQSIRPPAPQGAFVAPAETALVERLYPVADLITPLGEAGPVEVQNFIKLSGFDKPMQPVPGNANPPVAENQPVNANDKPAAPAPLPVLLPFTACTMPSLEP